MYSCMYLHIYTELRICIIKNFILCLCLLELGTVNGYVLNIFYIDKYVFL